jgi:hypothetical protein
MNVYECLLEDSLKKKTYGKGRTGPPHYGPIEATGIVQDTVDFAERVLIF